MVASEREIIKKIAEDFANELDFYDFKKTTAKYKKIEKELKLDQFPYLCLKHAPKDYPNIAYDHWNFDGKKINNYLCSSCYPRNESATLDFITTKLNLKIDTGFTSSLNEVFLLPRIYEKLNEI